MSKQKKNITCLLYLGDGHRHPVLCAHRTIKEPTYYVEAIIDKQLKKKKKVQKISCCMYVLRQRGLSHLSLATFPATSVMCVCVCVCVWKQEALRE